MNRVAAWAALCLVALGLPAGQAVAGPARGMPDPVAPGAQRVQSIDYDAQVAVVHGDLGGTAPVYADRLRGVVHAPTGKARPGPVVIVVPGRHDNCRVAGQDLGLVGTATWPCPDAPPAIQDLPSWRGFDYLGRNLASHGYVVAVINTNGVNSLGALDGAAERSQLIAATVDLLTAWHKGARSTPDGVGVALRGRVDLDRLGLVGHSRGADGVGRFLADEQALGLEAKAPGLRAILQLAGVDSTMGNPTPVGIHLGTLLGSCDADTGTSGTAMWERGRFEDPSDDFARVHWVVAGASHNLFNSEWYDEWDMPLQVLPLNGKPVNPSCTPTAPRNVRLHRSDQERVGLALMAGFLRRYVGGETALQPLMTGATTLPASACPTRRVGSGRPLPCDALVRTAYLDQEQRRRELVTVPGPLPRTTGLVIVTRCAHEDGLACPESGSDSVAPQLTVAWTGPAEIHLPLAAPAYLASFGAITLRAAMNPSAAQGAGRPTLAVDVVVSDTSGRTAAVPVSAWSHALDRPPAGSATPFASGSDDGYFNLTLHGARVPLAAFAGVDLRRVTGIDLRLHGSGSMQVSEILLQR